MFLSVSVSSADVACGRGRVCGGMQAAWAAAGAAAERSKAGLGAAALTSSSRMMRGPFRIVRAMATRCFSPPLSFSPRSPTWVLYPAGTRAEHAVLVPSKTGLGTRALLHGRSC